MSNDMIPANIQLPAYLRGQKSATASALTITSEARPQISIMGKMWKFIKDGVEKVYEQPVLTVVILGVDPPAAKTVSKSFYEGIYTPGSTDPPACSSEDGVHPSKHIVNPQHSNCAQCPQNVWGSAKSKVTGEDVKACRDHKTLLVCAPSGVEKGPVFSLRVPPTSFKALTEYGRSLQSHEIPAEGVITELRFAQVAHPQIMFTFGGFLPEDAALKAIARSQSDEVQDLLHYPPTLKFDMPAAQPFPPTYSADATAARVQQAPVQQDDPWATAAPVQQAPAAAPAVEFRPPYTARNSPPEMHVQRVVEGVTYADGTSAPVTIQSAPSFSATQQHRDVTGAVYNAELHATGRDGKPSILSDGTFRKRRGGASAATQTPTGQAPAMAPIPPHTEQPPADIGDLLKAWS